MSKPSCSMFVRRPVTGGVQVFFGYPNPGQYKADVVPAWLSEKLALLDFAANKPKAVVNGVGIVYKYLYIVNITKAQQLDVQRTWKEDQTKPLLMSLM